MNASERRSSPGKGSRRSAASRSPAWRIESKLKLLASPAFGAKTATRVLHDLIGDGPDDSRQVALAQFDRYGFVAAAVTGIAVACALVINNEIGVERIAELRFDHPFAAIAVCCEPWGEPTRSAAYRSSRHGSMPRRTCRPSPDSYPQR
jgi:hypothetical protein